MTKKNVLNAISWLLILACIVWGLWSWHDVVAHAMSGGTDNPLNLLNVLGSLI